jgi:hypothetical protein
VFPVRYELSFYIPEDEFFIVIAVKTSNLAYDIPVFSENGQPPK